MKPQLNRLLLVLLTTATAITTALTSPQTQAATQDILPSPITVGAGELHHLKLNRSLFIQKLLVQAESASAQPAFFDVIIQGQTVGTILTPAGDPTYIVTARLNTDSIEFRSLSGGPFRIVKLFAVTGAESSFEGAPAPIASYSEVARAVIQVVERIEPTLSPVEQWRHSLPIKVGAAQLYAVAYGHAAHDRRLEDAALDLMLRIDAAHPFFSQQITKGHSFELITHLWSLRERLEALTLKPSHWDRKKYNK